MHHGAPKSKWVQWLCWEVLVSVSVVDGFLVWSFWCFVGLVGLDFWCQLVRVWTCFVWVSGSALKCRPSQHACYTTCFNWRQGSKRFLWSVWSSKVKIKHANLKHGPYIFKQQIDLSQMRLPQLFETFLADSRPNTVGGENIWVRHDLWFHTKKYKLMQ